MDLELLKQNFSKMSLYYRMANKVLKEMQLSTSQNTVVNPEQLDEFASLINMVVASAQRTFTQTLILQDLTHHSEHLD